MCLGSDDYSTGERSEAYSIDIVNLWLFYIVPKLQTPQELPVLNPKKHLWDSLERKIRQRPITYLKGCVERGTGSHPFDRNLWTSLFHVQTSSRSFETLGISDFILNFKNNSVEEYRCSTYVPWTFSNEFFIRWHVSLCLYVIVGNLITFIFIKLHI